MSESRGSRRIAFGPLLAEAVLIVFSVLLALAVDQWRQDRADRRLVASVLSYVRGELDANRKMLTRRAAYHGKMHDATRAFLIQKEDRVPQMEDLGIDPKKGMGVAGSFSRTGWQLALNSGALEKMDIETIVLLSKVYEKQEELASVQEEFMKRAMTLAETLYADRKAVGELQLYSAFLTDLVLRERELDQSYDKALRKIPAAP